MVTRTLMSILRQSANPRLVRYLSAYIRQHNNPGTAVRLTSENWEEFAEGIRSTPVATKVDKLLRVLGGRSSYPGESITIEADLDYPLADAANKEELHFMIEHLTASGLIDSSRSAPTFLYHMRVLPKGWEKLQANTDKGIPGRCFVAMSFDASLNDAYSLAIEPALKDCGLEPWRVDRIPSNEDINDLIIAGLRDAEVVVADFTLQRNGVYFEAGFARGLGREVFWCCRKDDLKQLHFDTRQFSFIDWEDYDDLRTRLTNKIKALGFARRKNGLHIPQEEKA